MNAGDGGKKGGKNDVVGGLMIMAVTSLLISGQMARSGTDLAAPTISIIGNVIFWLLGLRILIRGLASKD